MAAVRASRAAGAGALLLESDGAVGLGAQNAGTPVEVLARGAALASTGNDLLIPNLEALISKSVSYLIGAALRVGAEHGGAVRNGVASGAALAIRNRGHLENGVAILTVQVRVKVESKRT